jgi:ATP-dependent protease Clp ATPase subunit
VQKLIAGPKVRICEECVDRCLDILADELSKKPQGCLLCGLTKEMQEMSRVLGRGSICRACIDEVRTVIEHLKDHNSQQTTYPPLETKMETVTPESHY